MTKRTYTLGQRAASQEDTRRRIVEATVVLHEQLGPRATTISAVAEKAGVQRLTVYRHFSDETELFKACSSHWLTLNPFPDSAGWVESDGLDRVYSALRHLYAYYGRTERMWSLSYRDEAEVPALAQPMTQVRTYLVGLRNDLVQHLGCQPDVLDPVMTTIGHAVQFSTWQSMARCEISDDAMAELVCDWLRGVLIRLKPSPHP